jgi:hypothetical protein
MSLLRRITPWMILAVAMTLAAGDEAPQTTLSIALGGLCEDYIEPCGCGGRTAGGLARRGAMIEQWRAETGQAHVLIEAGSLGMSEDRRPLIARCLALFGVDAVALSSSDLEDWARLAPLLAEHALGATCLTPPVQPPGRDGPPPPAVSRVVEAGGGWRVGVLSAAVGALATVDLSDAVAAETRRLHQAEHCAVVVLVSHLADDETSRLLGRLAEAERPDLIALATEADLVQAPDQRLGRPWVYLCHRGRSFSTAVFKPGAPPAVTTQLVDEGARKAAIVALVDEYYRQMREGETAAAVRDADVKYPRPAACAGCHAKAVAAWRLHPHARAVTTLEHLGRDVAGCLRCHDETLRRAGVRPAATGDRGVQCATCHARLEEHLKAPQTHRPSSLDRGGCEGCHTAENSPHWDYEAYRANVVGACGGRPQTRLHPEP